MQRGTAMSRLPGLILIVTFFLSCGILPAATGKPERKVITVQITADSENAGYEAYRAMDGDPQTLWHTQFNYPAVKGFGKIPIHLACGYRYGCNTTHDLFKPELPGIQLENNVPPPHYILVDLGTSRELTGFVYLPRKNAENGTIGDYSFYLSDDKNKFGEPVATGTFPIRTAARKDAPNKVLFKTPRRGRYVKFIGLTEVNQRPFTSIAELELLSETLVFRAAQPNTGDIAASRGITADEAQQLVKEELESGTLSPVEKKICTSVYLQDVIDQYHHLFRELSRPEYYEYVKKETLHSQSLIWIKKWRRPDRMSNGPFRMIPF